MTSCLTEWTDSGVQDSALLPNPTVPAPCRHRAPPGELQGAHGPSSQPEAPGAACSGASSTDVRRHHVTAPPPASSHLASALPSLSHSLGTQAATSQPFQPTNDAQPSGQSRMKLAPVTSGPPPPPPVSSDPSGVTSSCSLPSSPPPDSESQIWGAPLPPAPPGSRCTSYTLSDLQSHHWVCAGHVEARMERKTKDYRTTLPPKCVF